MSNDTNTTPMGGTPDTGDKTFTQEDVNRIVQERLIKERTKYEAGAIQKERELAQREFMLYAREILTEKGLPHDLLPALNTTSKEAFEHSLEVVQAQMEQKQSFVPPLYSATTGSKHIPELNNNDVRHAMGLKI